MTRAIIAILGPPFRTRIMQLIAAEKFAEEQGLSIEEGIALVTCSSTGGSLPISALPKLLGRSNVYCSRLANRLEQKLLVSRSVPSKDRRTVELTLTSDGWDTIELLAEKKSAEKVASLLSLGIQAGAILRAVAQREGISFSQLRCLFAFEKEAEALTASEVAKRCGIKRTCAIAALNSLCAQGYVRACGDNPKVYLLTLRDCQK